MAVLWSPLQCDADEAEEVLALALQQERAEAPFWQQEAPVLRASLSFVAVAVAEV